MSVDPTDCPHCAGWHPNDEAPCGEEDCKCGCIPGVPLHPCSCTCPQEAR